MGILNMSKLTRTSKFDFYPLTVLKQYISSYIIQLVCKFYDYCFCFKRWGEKDKDRSQSVYYFTKLRSSLVPRDSPQKWLDWVPQGAGFVHLLSIPVSGRNNNSLFQMKQLWKKKFCAKKKNILCASLLALPIRTKVNIFFFSFYKLCPKASLNLLLLTTLHINYNLKKRKFKVVNGFMKINSFNKIVVPLQKWIIFQRKA